MLLKSISNFEIYIFLNSKQDYSRYIRFHKGNVYECRVVPR